MVPTLLTIVSLYCWLVCLQTTSQSLVEEGECVCIYYSSSVTYRKTEYHLVCMGQGEENQFVYHFASFGHANQYMWHIDSANVD